ncbi:MAG: ABC transporter permease, partial [Polaromonas sp.]
MSSRRGHFYAWVLFAAGLLGWELLARQLKLSALVLPPPSVVFDALYKGLLSGYLWPHIGQTVLELVLGLAAGCVLGLAGGVALGESASLRRLLMPYVV